MNTKQGRRNFITKIAFGGMLALGMPDLAFAEIEPQKSKKIILGKNDVILFQGDSITDAGRVKTETGSNNQKALGSGYAFMAAADLLTNFPSKNLQVYNRGISGNKVYQLAERWENDALSLNPTIVSILIGVNDYWHVTKHGYTATVDTYEKDLRALMNRTKQRLPNARFVIGEPFAILGTAVDKTWQPAFKPYQNAARNVAESSNAVFIPYQKIFNDALKLAPEAYWSADGVHPTLAGARLMANAWMSFVKS